MKFVIVFKKKNMKNCNAHIDRSIAKFTNKAWKSNFWHDSETMTSSSIITTTIIFFGILPEDACFYTHRLIKADFPDYHLILENITKTNAKNIEEYDNILRHFTHNEYSNEVIIVNSIFHIPRVEMLNKYIIDDYKNN